MVEDADNAVYSLFLDEVVDSAVTAKAIGRETSANGILQRVRDYVTSEWPQTTDNDLWPYKDRENELSVSQGCLIWGNRVIVLLSLRSKVLRELRERHLGIERTKALARSYVWWLICPPDLVRTSRLKTNLSIELKITRVINTTDQPIRDSQSQHHASQSSRKRHSK